MTENRSGGRVFLRGALWRALHVLVDPPPHVLEDDVGLRLAAPAEGWRDRPDMHPLGTSPFRASIVARARFIVDLVVEQASWSTLAMTFLLPLELADPELRPGLARAEQGARASGTPFISFVTPTEILALAREAGFRDAQHTLTERYFADRTDGLRPPNNAGELLVATT